jgi:hypothetical protein
VFLREDLERRIETPLSGNPAVPLRQDNRGALSFLRKILVLRIFDFGLQPPAILPFKILRPLEKRSKNILNS